MFGLALNAAAKSLERGASAAKSSGRYEISPPTHVGDETMRPAALEEAQAGLLPALPLPPLEATLAALAASTECIVSKEDQHALNNAIAESLGAGSLLRELDSKLRERWPLNATSTAAADAKPAHTGGTSSDSSAGDAATGAGTSAQAVDAPIFRHYADEAWLRAYHRSRAPLPVNSNPFFVMEGDASPAAQSQIGRAVSVVRSALAFHNAVRFGSLKPDTFRGNPLCMAQYSKMFSCNRVPCLDEDLSCRYEGSRHIVIMANGHAFTLQVVSPCGAKVASVKALTAALAAIQEEANALPPAMSDGSAIGALTSQERDKWASARELLVAEGNAEALESVESAILCLCLDEGKPTSLGDEAASCLHGTSEVDAATGVQRGSCVNRWYDKSVSIIVSGSGTCGVNFEHSHLDGHTMLRFVSDLITDGLMSFARTINPSLPGILPALKDATDAEAACTPVRVHWITTGASRAAVRAAESRIADQVCRMRLATLNFSRFGKTGIVRRKCSPDGFVQLALQLAMWTVYGELVCTYETAMTKSYQHGRTEPIRAVTPEMVTFVKAFDELCGSVQVASDADAGQLDVARPPAEAAPAASSASAEAAGEGTAALMARAAAEHAGDPAAIAAAIAAIARAAAGPGRPGSKASAAQGSSGSVGCPAGAVERCAALRAALSAQAARTRTASSGMGGERHLFAMSNLASQLGLEQPALFTTAAWAKLNESLLSTSNCGNPSLRLFGFGNVADYGFGVGYLIKNDGLVFCVSSQRRDAHRFTFTLERALLRMAAAIDEAESTA